METRPATERLPSATHLEGSLGRGLGVHELQIVESPVEPASSEDRRVVSLLDDPSLIQNHQEFGQVGNQAHVVSDENNGRALGVQCTDEDRLLKGLLKNKKILV